MMALNTIITMPEDIWASRDGKPRERVMPHRRPSGLVRSRWKPLSFFSQWGAMIRIPITGARPVANTAPKIPMPQGKMNR